jgi:hypothetical protein
MKLSIKGRLLTGLKESPRRFGRIREGERKEFERDRGE